MKPAPNKKDNTAIKVSMQMKLNKKMEKPSKSGFGIDSLLSSLPKKPS